MFKIDKFHLFFCVRIKNHGVEEKIDRLKHSITVNGDKTTFDTNNEEA